MSSNDFQPAVQKLQKLLQLRYDLRSAIEISIKNADLEKIKTLKGFINYINSILIHVPSEKELMPSVRDFYYVLSKSPDDILKKDPAFNKWINDFVLERGSFMDSVESTKTLKTFFKNKKYKIEDYVVSPGGWLNYNQFLARHIKPGKRPIAERCNDKIIVSPCDSVYMGEHPITEDSTITAKGKTYSITQLLQGSKYKKEFKNGIFTHTFLEVTDYHRFHVPVSGKIKEVLKIPATTWITEKREVDGTVKDEDDVGFQFNHTRALIIIDSPVGYVAVIPIGMGHISSVNIIAEKGTKLVKGEELGYFAFGGSDIIILFQKDKVNLHVRKNKKFKMGEKIGEAITTINCS